MSACLGHLIQLFRTSRMSVSSGDSAGGEINRLSSGAAVFGCFNNASGCCARQSMVFLAATSRILDKHCGMSINGVCRRYQEIKFTRRCERRSSCVV